LATLKIKKPPFVYIACTQTFKFKESNNYQFLAGSFMKTSRITGSFEFYKRIEIGWSFDPVLFLKQKNSVLVF
jgi:hypothetical protein